MGCTTPSTASAAMAASMADPPDADTSRAAATARGDDVAAITRGATAVDRGIEKRVRLMRNRRRASPILDVARP